jgi:hypothetical protein
MATSQLSPDQIAWLSDAVAQYITAQRNRHAPRAAAIPAAARTALRGFFTPTVLDTTHVLTLHDERVQNPDFYPALEALGFRNLPDQSAMGAITFSDIVVSHAPFDDGLLFHELVHAEQYRQLGIQRFSELYVRGFLSGGCYERIPLEMHAYELGAQYEANPQRVFSVEEAVGRRIVSLAY